MHKLIQLVSDEQKQKIKENDEAYLSTARTTDEGRQAATGDSDVNSKKTKGLGSGKMEIWAVDKQIGLEKPTTQNWKIRIYAARYFEKLIYKNDLERG